MQGSAERPPRKVVLRPILLHNIYQLLPNRYQKNKSHSKKEAEVPPKKKGTKVVSCTQANRKGFSENPACGESFQKLCCMAPKYFFFFFLKGCLSENIKKKMTLIHEDKLQQRLLAKFARISKEV